MKGCEALAGSVKKDKLCAPKEVDHLYGGSTKIGQTCQDPPILRTPVRYP